MPTWRCPLFLRKIEKGFYVAENILLVISGITFLGLMFIGAGDVLGRYLLNKPIRGTMELSEIMMGAIVLLSWAYTQRNKGHVAVELFTSLYPPRIKAIVDLLTLFLSFVLFAFITQQSASMALRYWHEQRVLPTLEIPTAPFHALVPIGAAFLCIEFIIQMVHLVDNMRKG